MLDWILKADIARVTTGQMARVNPRLARGAMGGLTEALALVVTECPAVWGAPDKPDTYAQFPVFGAEMRTLREFYVQAVSVQQPAIAGVTFDLSSIKAAEFDQLLDVARQMDVDICIRLLKQFMTTCPLLEDPTNEAAYLKLKFFTEFRPLVIQLIGEAAEQLRNFLNPSAAT
jgi:hypothetical protein